VRQPRIVIVGAGMSGLCQAVLLKRAGFTDVTVLEKSDGLGGTWRDNRYPGLTCDVPSHLYQFSFDLNPSWTHLFSPGNEIREYFEAVARRRDLGRHIRYGTEVVDALHVGAHWRLTTAAGEVIDADFLILATGFLHRPRIPEFAGSAEFAGRVVHSARWTEDIGVAGKRVVVIGNGSTGVQLVSAIAGTASHVTLMQRTPQWVAHMPNPVIPQRVRAIQTRSGLLRQALLRVEYLLFDTLNAATTRDGFWRRTITRLCERNLASVRDPELRADLTPDYQPMCKRLIIHPTFYRQVQRSDVSVETSEVAQFEEGGVRTVDGRLLAADIIALATGFDAHAYVRPATVRTHDGHTLDAAWAQGPRAFKSVAVEAMPNLFMLLGPHSPIGNFSLVQISEAQAAYVVRWVTRWAAGEFEFTAPRAESVAGYLDHIRRGLPGTVWTTGCSSWYQGPDGLPELWPYPPQDYLALLSSRDDEDYVLALTKEVPCRETR
jgi:cation diffusion facilitator CzcD-associated flavoprotein CzcO